MKEDYQAAFLKRAENVSVLEINERKIAAMHLGGVTIECLLKYMIFATLPKGATWEWKTDSNDPGHTITNPGHSYQNALRRQQRLQNRIQRFPEVRQWLDDVENPGCPFINLRYSGDEPDAGDYQRWQKSYKRLKKWLQNQAT